ncbi:MAG: putative amidohydrolase YtcJ, partial [Myxococcota bacterium]
MRGALLLWLMACGGEPSGKGEDTAGETSTTPTGGSTPGGSTTPAGTTPAGTTAAGTPTTAPAVADRVLRGGRIYTVDPAQPWVEAVAIADGELVFVGTDAGAEAWVGPDTEVTELDGLMVLPGLHDVHVHLLEAFHTAASTCYTPPGVSLQRHVSTIRACAPDQVGTDWVLGYGFSIFDALYAPRVPALILDDAVPDRPAAILEETSHGAWVNTAALVALGIDRDTPDPVGGVILREADGRPSGLLLDAAAEMAFDLALEPNPVLDDMNRSALRMGVRAANANGLTSVADARAYWKRGYVEAWKEVATDGDLTLRSVVGLWAYASEDDDTQLAALKAMYTDDPTGMLRFTQVKLYDDGLLQNTTAALLEPYESPFTLAGPRGLQYFDAARLTRYATELEAVGFDLHVHAIGDRGVREALDAVEAARATNGDLGARHRLTHVEWAHPDDVPRFAELGVVADMQMSYKWVEQEYLADQAFFVGEERARERQWPLRDLYDSGARLTLSSDYDVGSLSPFDAMARAIDRGPQSLPDLHAAIRAYTL